MGYGTPGKAENNIRNEKNNGNTLALYYIT
jgi:hypothetical protein